MDSKAIALDEGINRIEFLNRHHWAEPLLGVIEEGAYADLLLINGDPLKDISILTKPEENLALIMKDGKIYKNTVE